VATAEAALALLDRHDRHRFDLVITMPRLADMDAFSLGRAIKARAPALPVVMLSHGEVLSNDAPEIETRLAHLFEAVKRVYASSYFRAPKAFSKRVGHRTEEEKMAVIIQQLVGERTNGFFYPAISGVGHSCNYYPFGRQRQEDGIVTIALGLGCAVMAGEQTLRFSPKYPQLLPQHTTVGDILDNAQRHFYSLKFVSYHKYYCPLAEGTCLHLKKKIYIFVPRHCTWPLFLRSLRRGQR
jgi:CheY-like chemotaxis protein